MAPIVERLQAEHEGRVDVWKVNAAGQPEVARALGILGIPTLIAFHAGKEIVRKVGAGSEADLRAAFEAALSGVPPAHRSISPLDRALRLAAGSAVIVLAPSTGPSLILLAVGSVLLLTAVADRCPIGETLRPRLRALLRRRRPASH